MEAENAFEYQVWVAVHIIYIPALNNGFQFNADYRAIAEPLCLNLMKGSGVGCRGGTLGYLCKRYEEFIWISRWLLRSL